MDPQFRYWLLTNTCYGTWLPGDARGFVGRVRERRPGEQVSPRRVVHNQWQTPCDAHMPGLERASADRLKSPPIHLSQSQAEVLVGQFRETAQVRQWRLLAVAVMFNHFHVVVGAPVATEAKKIISDFKSWGTRALSHRFGKPPSVTWWTENGSKRPIRGELALATAIRYVLSRQPSPLVVWSGEEY